jgi:hypothetical protein
MAWTSEARRAGAALLILGALAAVTAVPAGAQDVFIGFSYGMGVTTGDTQDFIGRTSFRGFAFDWRKAVRDRVTAGFHVGWSVFNENTTRTASFPGVDISGKQFRYINAYPILANMHYDFGRRGGLRPYIGGHAGAYIVEQRVELGLYSIEQHNWHFGLGPGGGVSLPFGDDKFGFLDVRYNHVFKNGETIDHSWWSFNIGVGSRSLSL